MCGTVVTRFCLFFNFASKDCQQFLLMCLKIFLLGTVLNNMLYGLLGVAN